MNEQVLIILSLRDTTSSWGLITSVSQPLPLQIFWRRQEEKKKTFLCVCIFCRSARALPCDVVAEPQTSTLQVESSDQIHSDDSFVLVFETRFFTVLLYIYIVYIYTLIDTRAETRLFFISLYYLSLSLYLSFFLSLSFSSFLLSSFFL